MKKLIICLALLVPLASFSAGYYVGSGAYNVNIEGAANTNSSTLSTNGQYSAAITGNVLQTNLMLLNPGVGNNLILEFTASAAGDMGNTTNMVFNIMSTVTPPTVITTNGSGAWTPSATTPLQSYKAQTMTFSATSGVIVKSNIVLNPYTTPPFSSGMKLYLYSIQVNATNAAYATNYGINSIQY